MAALEINSMWDGWEGMGYWAEGLISRIAVKIQSLLFRQYDRKLSQNKHITEGVNGKLSKLLSSKKITIEWCQHLAVWVISFISSL